MQCEREDAAFMGVSLMVRLVSPRNSCIRHAAPVLSQTAAQMCLHQACIPRLEHTLHALHVKPQTCAMIPVGDFPHTMVLLG